MSSDCVISEYITHISMCIHAWRMHVWSDTATAYDCLCLKASLKQLVTRGFHHRSSDSQHTLPGVAPDITNCTHVVCIVLYQSILYHTHISMRMHAWRMHVWSCTRHNKLYACQRMQFWSYTIHNTLYACHQSHPCVIISLVKSFEQL